MIVLRDINNSTVSNKRHASNAQKIMSHLDLMYGCAYLSLCLPSKVVLIDKTF